MEWLRLGYWCLTPFIAFTENRLIGATLATGKTINFLYDPEGQLVGQSEGEGTDPTKTIRYLVDKNASYSQILEERDGNGKLLARYDFAPNNTTPLKQQVLVTTGSTESLQAAFYHSDHLSVRLLTDATGNTLNTYTYSPYGEVIAAQSTGTFPNVHLFTGERFHTDLGMTYLRARWMDVRTGRFIGVDPHPGAMARPVTLHDYVYANGNSISNTDPAGRMSLGEAMQGLNIASNLLSVAVEIRDYFSPSEDSGSSGPTLWDLLFMLEVAVTAAISDPGGTLLAAATQAPSRHHIIPEYLCGSNQQRLVSLPAWRHAILHGEMDVVGRVIQEAGLKSAKFLKGRSDKNKSELHNIGKRYWGRKGIVLGLRGFYQAFGWFGELGNAVAFDPLNRLGWRSISDGFNKESEEFVNGKTSKKCK